MEPTATVRKINGQLVLDDPYVQSIVEGRNRAACRNTFELHKERIDHFVNRVTALQLTAEGAVIVIANVDEKLGALLAGVLMPEHNWQAYRNRGEIPFARGLALRQGIQAFLDKADSYAAEKLSAFKGLSVVVIDYGVIEVFPPR